MVIKGQRVLVVCLGIFLLAVVIWGVKGEADRGPTPNADGKPSAHGVFSASPLAPGLQGSIEFYPVEGGTIVKVELQGLPLYQPAGTSQNPVGPHGFHIHENGVCEIGDPQNPFQTAGGHWNPDGQPHGNHAGDFPVLFSDQGQAVLSFVTHRFSPQDVVGLSVIVHENPDDYRSQPAGDSGRRLGCAVIEPVG